MVNFGCEEQDGYDAQGQSLCPVKVDSLSRSAVNTNAIKNECLSSLTWTQVENSQRCYPCPTYHGKTGEGPSRSEVVQHPPVALECTGLKGLRKECGPTSGTCVSKRLRNSRLSCYLGHSLRTGLTRSVPYTCSYQGIDAKIFQEKVVPEMEECAVDLRGNPEGDANKVFSRRQNKETGCSVGDCCFQTDQAHSW